MAEGARRAETDPGATAAFIVAAFGVFVAADDLLVVSTMLRPIIGDLGLALPDDLDMAAWIVNVYLIAYLAVMPLAGKLSDVFGRRLVFVVSMCVFAAGSLIVPLAGSLQVLLVGRALTAIGGGALVPVALGIAADGFTGGARARAFGTLGAIETMGWIWGPIYGALLVRFLSWEWQFYLNLPLAVVGIVAAMRVLPQPLGDRADSRPRVDVLGAALLTLALVAGGLALLGQADIGSASNLSDLGRDRSIGIPLVWSLAAAAVGSAGFAWRQRRATAPLLDLSFPYAHRRLAPGAALGVNLAFGAALITALVNVPLLINVLESDQGTAALRSGLVLTALTGTMALASWTGGMVTAAKGARLPSSMGFSVTALGLIALGLRWDPATSLVEVALFLAVTGTGLGLAMTPTTTALTDASPDGAGGTTAGLVLVFRMIGFSLGLAALTAFGLRRFDALRSTLDLPPLTDPTYTEAATDAVRRISTQALSETFTAAGVVALIAAAASSVLPSGSAARRVQRVDRSTLVIDNE